MEAFRRHHRQEPFAPRLAGRQCTRACDMRDPRVTEALQVPHRERDAEHVVIDDGRDAVGIRRARGRGERRARGVGTGTRASLAPWWLAAMLVIGPIVFFTLWPWMWHDTLPRLGAYARFHVKHDYYNMAYFGVNHFWPPFPVSFPWVMTLYTVSLATLALALVGIATRLRTLVPPYLMEKLWPNGSTEPDRARTDVLRGYL